MSDLISAGSVRVAHPLFHAEGGGSIPTSALQLHVCEINPRLAQKLNRLWHSLLPETHLGNLVGNNRNVFYGAEHSNVWYACAMWTQPIAANRLQDGDLALELRRFAISDDAPKNTASRVLAVMTKLIRRKYPDLQRLISYQALDHHNGTIYKAAGWEAAAQSSVADWGRDGDRSRAKMQTRSDKIRWELWLQKD